MTPLATIRAALEQAQQAAANFPDDALTRLKKMNLAVLAALAALTELEQASARKNEESGGEPDVASPAVESPTDAER